MDWQLSALNPPMTTIFFTWVRIPEPDRDLAAAAKARDAAERLWAIVEVWSYNLGAGLSCNLAVAEHWNGESSGPAALLIGTLFFAFFIVAVALGFFLAKATGT